VSALYYEYSHSDLGIFLLLHTEKIL